MFWCYYVAWPCDLDLWPWECFVYNASHVRPTYQFLLSYDYRLLSYEYWISDHISVIWNSHCAVTWPLTVGKNSPHFWNPWPQFVYHFLTFTALQRRLSHVIGKKIAFSHSEGYKVYCACAVSRDLCIGGPPKPHVTIFNLELPIHYTTFMRLRWRLRVVYIWASPLLKQFSVAKNCPVKIGPQNGGFSEIKGFKYKI